MPFVVAWEDGVELSHAVAAGRLQAAHLSGVQTALAHGGINAAVTARGVGLWPGEVSIVLDSFDWEKKRRGKPYSPDVDEQTRDWLASVDIDELHFEMDGHTGLAFSDVLTDELAEDVVWPGRYLRSQDAARVGGEQDREVRASDRAGHVVVGRLKLLQCSKIAVVEVGYMDVLDCSPSKRLV